MILVYGDDSSDEKRQRVSAVAVVIGSEESWQWIEPQWIARNDGIPFHARDCESDQGDYKNVPHEKNKNLYKNLTTMLAFSELSGLGIAVDLVAQRQVFPDSLDLAYFKAFAELLQAVKDVAHRYAQPAKFTFDISTENEYNAGLLYSAFREDDPEMFELLSPEISFVPAKYSPRVQVADLMAYEAMKALDHAVGPHKRRRKSWDVLRVTKRFDVIAHSHEWFQGLKSHTRELEREVGYSQLDYEKWLVDKRRQPSVSNLFHFMNWIARRDRQSGI